MGQEYGAVNGDVKTVLLIIDFVSIHIADYQPKNRNKKQIE